MTDSLEKYNAGVVEEQTRNGRLPTAEDMGSRIRRSRTPINSRSRKRSS